MAIEVDYFNLAVIPQNIKLGQRPISYAHLSL